MVLLLIAVAGGGYFFLELRRERKFTPQIQAAASRYGVDPLLIRALIWRESRFRPGACGSKGEIGLMQIRDSAARDWAQAEHLRFFTQEDCFDPGTNTMAGAFYLGKLLKRYARTDNPVPYALADYNAGRGNVIKWNAGLATTNSAAFLAQIGFPGTRSYVKSIEWRYSFFRWLARMGWA